MLKLQQKFLKRNLFIFLIFFFIILLFSFFTLKEISFKETKANLRDILEVATINQIDALFLEKLSKKIDARVTLFKDKTIFDSRATYKFNRDDYIFATKKVDNKTLRVAILKEKIYKEVLKKLFIIAIFLAFFLGGLLYFINRFNLEIIKNLHRVDRDLNLILQKEPLFFREIKFSKEFAKIAKKIERVAKRVNKAKKQKLKYKRALKDIAKRQSDIIFAISHEFKNPVAAILGYSQTLREGSNLNEELKSKFLEKIESNAFKLSNMIDTIALLMKLESQTIALNKNSFNLKDAISEAIEILKQKYQDREIKLECQDICIRADRNMFVNIFINLIENAIRYSQSEVLVRCAQDRVEIIDYGVGIKNKDIKKIKKMFYRTNDISSNNSIGVGLYIVDYILKLHNLELNIKSYNKKTVVSFNISKIECN